jgi:hypothetical protein
VSGVRVVVRPKGAEIRVDCASDDLVREVGPLAWVAFERMLLAGHSDGDGGWEIATSARDLATRLGVGKDRAADALARLRRAGLIVLHMQRDRSTSRFSANRYELRVSVSPEEDTVTSGVGDVGVRQSRRRDARNEAFDRLQLFDA